MVQLNQCVPPAFLIVCTSNKPVAAGVCSDMLFKKVSVIPLVILWQAVSANPGWQSRPLNCIACCCLEMGRRCQRGSGGAVRRASALTSAAGVCQCCPAHTLLFPPETLYLLKFHSSSELRAGEPPGGEEEGGGRHSYPNIIAIPHTHFFLPPGSIFKLGYIPLSAFCSQRSVYSLFLFNRPIWRTMQNVILNSYSVLVFNSFIMKA